MTFLEHLEQDDVSATIYRVDKSFHVIYRDIESDGLLLVEKYSDTVIDLTSRVINKLRGYVREDSF